MSEITAEGWNRIWTWWDDGVIKHQQYMLVVWDAINNTYYPVFCDARDIECKVNLHNIWNQQVMEIYNLRLGRVKQLQERRAWNGPASVSGTSTEGRKQGNATPVV